MQFFKGDEKELQFYNAIAPTAQLLSTNKDEFFNDAYACFVLGELIYDNNRAPLTRAIPREIFRESFKTIFDAFIVAGTFEGYLSVFRNIFGEDVEVTFDVPAPGKLTIDIVAAGVVESPFIAREIIEDEYVSSNMITQDGVDRLVFQTVKGFQSQYELEQMLFEMVPDGIYTEISLTLGEE